MSEDYFYARMRDFEDRLILANNRIKELDANVITLRRMIKENKEAKEKAEAELAKLFSDPATFHVAALRMLSPTCRDHLLGHDHIVRVRSLEAELAKREKALEQAVEVGGIVVIVGELYRESSIYGTDSRSGYCTKEACPELAEWLQNREK